MSNFILKNLLPQIQAYGSCNNNSDGIGMCNSPLASVINKINPVANFQIDPLGSIGLKQGKTCDKFEDLFTRASVPNAVGWKPPTQAQWDAFNAWTVEMTKLAKSNHAVLACMLEMLCACEPKIDVFFAPELKINPKTGDRAYALTRPYNGRFQMCFAWDTIHEREKVLVGEYLMNLYYYFAQPRAELTIDIASADYYAWDPGEHYYISYVVHELGHVLDKLYWRNFASSEVHAFMWQSFYHQEFWMIKGIRIPTFYDNTDINGVTQNYSFLNLPNPARCSSIQAKLNAINNPDLVMGKKYIPK